MTARLRILGTSERHDPTALRAGHDLVVHAPPWQGARLARGTLLDDWLDLSTRDAIQAAAYSSQSAWQSRLRDQLTVDGTDLAWIHDGELFADVFLREARVLEGLRSALEQIAPRRVDLDAVDPVAAAIVGELLEDLGIPTDSVAADAPEPTYPIEYRRSAGRRTTATVARELLGIPPRAHGAVLLKPYWHLEPVARRLAQAGGTMPVLDPVDLPRIDRRALLRLLRDGGWVGHPGALGRRRSRASTAAAIAGGRDSTAGRLDRLAAVRAEALLRQRALDTVATVRALRSTFARGRVRTALLPSDGTPAGRTILTATRPAGMTAVQIQHGFFGDAWRVEGRLPSFIDGLEADRVGVWSDRMVATVAPQARGAVTTTGNPGLVDLARGRWPARRAPRPEEAVVLVQPPIGSSARIDVRTPNRHVESAIAGLGAAGFATITLRPHPLDPSDYRSLEHASTARLRVDRERPIEEILGAARICVGAVSTATLQSAAAGIPTVFLHAAPGDVPWPFDGSGSFPVARDADELGALAARVVAGVDAGGASEAREALGLRDDAVERVLALLPTSA